MLKDIKGYLIIFFIPNFSRIFFKILKDTYVFLKVGIFFKIILRIFMDFFKNIYGYLGFLFRLIFQDIFKDIKYILKSSYF